MTRDAVVAEARSWIGTPFHLNAAVKHAGVDCGRFPWLVYRACGIELPELPKHWPRDFMCHRMADGEPYLTLIEQKFDEVEVPLPGDLAVFKPHRSRCYSHAAIVVEWPSVIHARGVGARPQVEPALAQQWPLEGSPVRFFTFHDPQK